jgi:hypothetical protein
MKYSIALISYLSIRFNRYIPYIFDKFDSKINIVFYAPAAFHALHFSSVIKLLEKNPKYSLHLVGEFEKIFEANYYPSSKYLPLYKKYALFITTEMVLPWNIDTQSVYFGHGIGPKLDYNSSKELSDFDYCFCSCKPIFDVQTKLNDNCLKIGLPILELKSKLSREEILERFSIKDDKPIILYAPSWHGNFDLVSDVKQISLNLLNLKDFNVIVSPHPNLFKAELCQGVDVFGDIKGLHINQGGDISSLDIVKGVADIVVSDISSLLFEAMVLEKRAIFDGNEAIYVESKAEHVLKTLKASVFTCDWSVNLKDDFTGLLESQEKMNQQNWYIQNYAFNIGASTQACLMAIKDITNAKRPINN